MKAALFCTFWLFIVTSISAKVLYLKCEEMPPFSVDLSESHAWLFLPQKTERLDRLNSALYANDQFRLTQEDGDYFLTSDQSKRMRCYNYPKQAAWEEAKLQGYDLRALSKEGLWELRLKEGGVSRLRFNKKRHAFWTSPALLYDRFTRWDLNQTVHIELYHTPCRISSNEILLRSLLIYQNMRYEGCAKALH